MEYSTQTASAPKVAAITDSITGIVFLGVTVVSLGVLAVAAQPLEQILTMRSLPRQMLEDSDAQVTTYDGLYSGFKDTLMTW